MDFGGTKSALINDAAALVQNIRAFSVAQKELWQLVPWLALQADGRGGYSDSYAAAFYHGLWRIEASISNGYYGISVDCATGALVDACIPTRSATVKDILMCVRDLNQLDAEMVVAELRQKGREPYFRTQDVQGVEERRAKIVKEYGLGKVFIRKRGMPEFKINIMG